MMGQLETHCSCWKINQYRGGTDGECDFQISFTLNNYCMTLKKLPEGHGFIN